MQQTHAPRPLPLFLELVRMISAREPVLAAKALQGLSRYEHAPRSKSRPQRPEIARSGAAALRDCGGSGPPVVLVPSLINPPDVLDLDERVSLGGAIARMGRKALLLDWGSAGDRAELDLGRHIEQLLLPLLEQLAEPPVLIGYCLGGTMAIAATNLGRVERVATLAAPWRFSNYPEDSRRALLSLWTNAKTTARELHALPMEVLQSAFWSLDPMRTVSKFADLADLDDKAAARFVTLEDWANEGEPLPYPAAREVIEDLFGRDLPGNGKWQVGGRTISAALECPLLNVTASADSITPAATAPSGPTVAINSGHVGMIVGSAREKLHSALAEFLGAPCR